MKKKFVIWLAGFLIAGFLVASQLGGTTTETANSDTNLRKPIITTTTAYYALNADGWIVETTTTSPPITRAPARRSQPVERAPANPTDDIWWALALCESGGNNDTGDPYWGYFQFLPSTWRSVGETGLPSDYSYEHQKAAAQRLQARSGWGQWPACARKLGLI